MKITKIQSERQEQPRLRVAAYCRVSTENDDQRNSLETQKSHFESWIRLHSDWENAGIFYDFGISGTNKDARDGLQALLYECRIGRIDYILTKSVSRFARNTVDCLSIVRELLEYNIPIYFEKENLDTGSMESELILSIISSLAQGESESISQNVKWSIKKRYENGTYRFGYLPYGYQKDDDGNIVVNKEEAPIIRYIFDCVLSGIGAYSIAKELTAKNIPSRKGSRWSESTILDILVNEKYVGDVRFQKTYTDEMFRRHNNHGEVESRIIHDHHEAIVSREVFEKANALLVQRAQMLGMKKGIGKYHQRYVFSGKIICNECDGKFKRQTYCSGISWACTTHIRDNSKCSIKYIKEEAIQSAFVTMMNKLIFAHKLILRPLYDKLQILQSDANLQNILQYKKILQDNAERKDELRKLRGRGIIDNVLYTQEANRIDKQCEDIRSELKQLENEVSGATIQELKKLLRFTESSAMLLTFNDEIFTDFVDNIIVYSRNCIGFQLKCGLTLKEELCLDTK